MTYELLAAVVPLARDDRDIERQLEIEAGYDGYVQRQSEELGRLAGLEETRIPVSLEYERVEGLSSEVKEKLRRIEPRTLGQASRISGVTPAALSALAIHLKKRRTA
jgi:tRNA uridine 5-carboxymethylaminomethyl modification enzyme